MRWHSSHSRAAPAPADMVLTTEAIVGAIVLGVVSLIVIFLARRALEYFVCVKSPWAAFVGIITVVAAVLLLAYAIVVIVSGLTDVVSNARSGLFLAALFAIELAILAMPFMLFHAHIHLTVALAYAVAATTAVVIQFIFGLSLLGFLAFFILVLFALAFCWFAWYRAGPYILVAATTTDVGATSVVTEVADNVGLAGAVMSARFANNNNNDATAPGLKKRTAAALGRADSDVSSPLLRNPAVMATSVGAKYGDTIFGVQYPIASRAGFIAIALHILSALLLPLFGVGCSELWLDVVVALALLIHAVVIYIASPPV